MAASSDLAGGAIRILPPWIVAAVLPLPALGCRALWGAPDTLPWAAMIMTLLTVGMTWLTWRVSHARRRLGRIHVTTATAAALGWVTVATVSGLHRPVFPDMWLFGGFAICGAWTLRHGVHSGAGEPDDLLRAWWSSCAEKIGLPGSTLRTKAVDGIRGVGELTLGEGQTVREVASRREAIAGAAGIPANGVRITPDPGNAGKATVTLVREDLLERVVAWPGPSHVGGLPTDPHEIGTYEDGERMKIVLPAVPGDPMRGIQDKNAYHLGLAGKTGSGKSGAALIIAADWLCRREAVVFVVDVVKRYQTFGALRDLIDWYAITPKDSGRMLKAVRDRLVPALGSYLGEQGLPYWRPGCGVPAILLVIEEALALPPDQKQVVVDLLRQTRSVGINIILSGQRWTYDALPTSARAEIGGTLMFGCGDGDAAYLLGDLANRGADPSVWGNRHPGRCYASVPDVPDERHIVPLRVDFADPARVGELVRRNYIHTKMPNFLVSALGDAWTSRPRHTAPGDEPVVLPGAQISARDSVPDLRDFPPVPPPPPRKAAPEEVRTALLDILRTWGEGQSFRPADVARALRAELSRDRSTVSRYLRKLVEDGYLETDGNGFYTILTLHPPEEDAA